MPAPPESEPGSDRAEPGAVPDAAPEAALDAALRLAEALIFASDRPVPTARLQPLLPEQLDAAEVLRTLVDRCADRPVVLAEVAGGFAFRTAPALAPALTRIIEVPRRLPRAAMETLAIIAWHQPVTRADIEAIRGAAVAQPTIDALLELALVAPRGHKDVPGRPALWATTPRFLEQFGLGSLADLPRREELVAEPVRDLLAPPEEAAAPPADR